jgi:hypothetical protein
MVCELDKATGPIGEIRKAFAEANKEPPRFHGTTRLTSGAI